MTSYRPFSCELCYQSFTRSENLERHKQTRHGGVTRKPYECRQCQARFSRRDVCKRHTERCQGRPVQRQQAQVQVQDQDQGPLPAEWPNEDSLSMFAALVPSPGLTFDPENPIFDAPIPPVESVGSPSVDSTLSIESTNTYIKSFFEHFYPSLPLVHRPTFTTASTPKTLMNITAIIGSLYTAQTYSKEEQVTCANWRKKAWEEGYDELNNLTSSDWKELGKTWVMQAWLLHIIYGAYLGDGSHYEMAKQMLRSLVDAIRELGVLQQSTAFPLATSWIAQSKRSPLRSESQPLQECWMAYVNEESMRLSLYVLLFLDTQISSPCNLRPLISPIEFGWELPYSSSLWEANNAHNWLQRLSDEYLGPSTSPYGELHLERGKATSSLSLATQELMSECPSSGLLATLRASPFATLCVLTNLDQLVRDFTRCYYQLPPNLSDPSAFHILTQSQNRQVMAAIRIVTKMVQEPPKPSQALLWHTIELMTFSIKISLCQPDELLIGGVVDTSLVAGLATATHLTLGSYVAVRRSAPFRLQQKSKDDGALSIISELLTGLSRILAVEEQGFAAREAPWATVATFRMLLMIWQVLRRATSEIRKHIEAENKAPEKYEPSMLIFSALMETLVGFAADETARYSRDSDVLSNLDESEALFMKIIFRICQSRSVWGIGGAMEKLMEEIKVE